MYTDNNNPYRRPEREGGEGVPPLYSSGSMDRPTAPSDGYEPGFGQRSPSEEGMGTYSWQASPSVPLRPSVPASYPVVPPQRNDSPPPVTRAERWTNEVYAPQLKPAHYEMSQAVPDEPVMEAPKDPWAPRDSVETQTKTRTKTQTKQKNKWRVAFVSMALVALLLVGALVVTLTSLGVGVQTGDDGQWHLVSNQTSPPPDVSATPDAANTPNGESPSDSLVLQDPPAVTSAAVTAGEPLSISEIVKMNMKSVVGINVSDSNGNIVGSGSGIVMTADGYIITNNHVVEDAVQVTVVFDDNQSYTAVSVKTDRITDLAVIKIEATGLSPATFGNSEALEVGDLAVVIGNPMGMELQNTVTNGIISSINRDIVIDERNMTMIQTNCAINPGNSGGPLFNQFGQVVGIVSSKIMGDYMSNYSVEGLGFAIPINTAKPIIDELITRGYVKGRPAIGLSGQPVTDQESRFYGVPEGLQITSISPLCDAAIQGVTINDIITHVNGTAVTTVAEINEIKSGMQVGDEMTFTLYRPSTQATMEIKFKLMDEGELYNKE